MNISDIIELTDEAKKAEVKGVVELGNLLEKEDYLEKNPEDFFNKTYLTDSLKEILESISFKAEKKSPFGSFSISGNYGSGKSHILISLYHYFKNSSSSRDWLKKYSSENLSIKKDYNTVLIPLNFISTEDLWVPIFSQLERNDLLKEIGDYPTVPQIKAALAKRKIVIFFDEIEKWYQSIDEVPRKTRNKIFIQNLLHIANESNSNLFVFISLLLEGTDLEEVINRQTTRRFDLHKEKEKKEIIRFRIIKDILNKEGMKEIINNYLAFYFDSEFAQVFTKSRFSFKKSEYEKKFIDSYPYHPYMLDTLISKYQERQKYGNVRGLLYLLSSVLIKSIKINNHKKILVDSKDVVLLSDVDLASVEVLALNRPLTIDCRNDFERIKKIPDKNHRLIKQLLSSCLIFSINETPQDYANISDLIVSSSRPNESHNPNEIIEEITELPKFCPHFHSTNGTIAICREINPEAEINLRSEDIKNTEAIELIKVSIIEKFNKEKKIIVDFLENKNEKKYDNRNIKLLLSMNPQIKTWTLIRPYIEHTIFQNSFILIIPKSQKALTDDLILIGLAKRMIAEQKLIEETDKPSKKQKLLNTIYKTDKEHFHSRIVESYGFWLKYINRDNFNLRKLRKFEAKEVLKQVTSDMGLVRNKILEVITSKKQAGIKIAHLKDDFYKIRSYPILIDLKKIDEMILMGCKEKDYVLQDSHSRLFSGNNLPNAINENMIVFSSSYKDIPKFECDDCGNEFDTEQELEMHKKQNHPEFTCPKCSSIFKFATELQTHIENEHTKRKFNCDFCGDVFDSEVELLEHVKRNHEKPDFTCQICNESFNSAIHLQKHMTEKHQTFECKICSKIFSSENDLNDHIDSAHYVPEFICKICGSSFTKAEQLQFHVMTDHPKPLSCHFCDEKFPSKEQLNKHILSVHEIIPTEKSIQIIENNSLAALSREIERKLLEKDIITYIGLKIILAVTEEGINNLIPSKTFFVSDTSTLSLNFELDVKVSPIELSTFIQKLPFQRGKFSLNLNVRRE